MGQVTRGLRGVDVMEGGVEPNKYQISQQRRGKSGSTYTLAQPLKFSLRRELHAFH